MKKIKTFTIVLIIMLLTLSMCFYGKVYAEEVNTDEVVENTDETTPESGEETPTNEENATEPEEGSTDETNGEEEQGIEGEQTTEGEEGDGTEEVELPYRDEDLYIYSTDDTYELTEDVVGNVYIFGKNVTVSSYIDGDLFIYASESIKFTENAFVQSNIFAFTKAMEIDGLAYNAYVCATDSLTFGENAYIGRDLKVYTNYLYLTGLVGRDVNAIANTITCPIEEEKLTISGDFNYTASNEAENIDKIKVEGETHYNEKISTDSANQGKSILDYVISAITTLVFDLVLFGCFIFLAPKFVENAKNYISVKGVISLIIGIPVTVLVVVLPVLLFITGIGAYLGVTIFVAGMLLFLLQAFVVALAISSFIADKIGKGNNTWFKLLLIGLTSIVLWIIRHLPFVGWIFSIITFLLGVGIIVLYQFNKRETNTEANV